MRSKLFYFVWGLVGVLSFFLDWRVLGFFDQLDWHSLDSLMVFLTDFGLLFVVAGFLMLLFEEGKWNYLVLLAVALFVTVEGVFLLKVMFQVPRPFEFFVDLKKLAPAVGYSFPSLHTAVVFAMLPFFRLGRLKYLRGWWVLFCVLIGLSRLYVGVHHLSDAVWGGFAGYLVGDIVYGIESKRGVSDWFLWHIKDKFELRRQVMHMFTGLAIAFLLYLELIGATFLGVCLIGGGVLILLSRKRDLPVLRHFLDFFERHSMRRKWPGKGSFCLVLGCFLSVVLFRHDIAIAAIIVMSIGDSVTNIIGRYFGEINIPWNREKQFEGPLMGGLLAFLGAMLVVPWWPALAGSVAAMAVETWDFKVGGVRIDDNLIVPLVAGVVMGVVS